MQQKQMEAGDKPLIYVEPKKRRVFFVILYLLFIFDFISRIGINSIFPVIQSDLGLSDTQVGMMGSVVLVGMAVLVLPVSFLGEKYSPKKAISLSALVWSVGTFLSGIAGNFSLLLSSRFLVGAGNSAYAPLSNSMLTSMYSKKEWGRTIGLYNTAMSLGMALGALVFAHLAENFGWRMAFYTVSAISFLLTIASLALPDPKAMMNLQSGEKAADDSKKKTSVNVKDALHILGSNKALLGVCLGAGLGGLVNQGILSWLSIYFVREMDMSLGFAATLISVLSLLTAFGYPIGGTIMDRWYKFDRRCRVLLPSICLAIAVVGFIVGFRFRLIPAIFIGCLCITTASTSYHVSTQELVPTWYKSVSYGVYVLFLKFFGAMGPVLTGFLSETFGLIPALSIIQVCLLVSIVVFLLTSRVYIKYADSSRQLEAEAGL